MKSHAVSTGCAGQTFLTLTTGVDVPTMTAGNDTVTGTSSTLGETDSIIDQSTTDNDTLNLTISSGTANVAATIVNVENINVNWNQYTTAGLDLTGVVGAKVVTVSTSKVGSLGNMTVSDGGANNIVAGDGMIGTVAVNDSRTGAQLTANKAASVTLDTDRTSQSGAVVNSTSATSVTVTDFSSATVNAGYTGTSTLTVSVTDAGKSSNTSVVNVGAAAVNINGSDVTGTLTVNSTAATATITAYDSADAENSMAVGDELIIGGTGDVTLSMDGNLDGAAITNAKTAGTLTIKSTDTGGVDLSDVTGANLVWFTGAKTAGDTVLNGANLKYSGSGTDVRVEVEGSGTADAVTVTVTSASLDDVIFTGVETANWVASAASKAGVDQQIDDLSIASATSKVVMSGSNDVTIDAIITTGVLDASALTGDLTVTAAGATNKGNTITGSAGHNVINGLQTTANLTVTTFAGDDDVTTDITTGSATIVLGEGDNSVDADGTIAVNGDLVGALVVTAGAGDDEVTVSAVTSGVVNLSLGDGDNVVDIGAEGTVSSGTVSVTTGAGMDDIEVSLAATPTAKITVNAGGDDDTITIDTGVSWASGSRLVVDGGDGDDILSLADGTNLNSASVVTISNVEIIEINDGGDFDNAVFKAATLSGKSFEIRTDDGEGEGAAGFTVQGTTTTSTVDLSTLTINREVGHIVDATKITVTSALQGVTITGTRVADTIIGSGYADTIVSGNGADTITGGAGDDSITITETTANQVEDTIVFSVHGTTNGVDTITGFKVGIDKLEFAAADNDGEGIGYEDAETTATESGFDTSNVAVVAGVAAGTSQFDISGDLDAGAEDAVLTSFLELETTLTSKGDLDLARDGTELLKALSSTVYSLASLKTDAGSEFLLAAYQDGNAYIYHVDAGAESTAAVADEITLMAVLTGITAGTLTFADVTYTAA